MRIRKRARKRCIMCGRNDFPPVYALQHFYEVFGKRNQARRIEPHTERTVQVVTSGLVCWECVHSGKFYAEVTRGYEQTRSRILEIADAIRQGDQRIGRTALFYEPLWYTPPEFWEI